MCVGEVESAVHAGQELSDPSVILAPPCLLKSVCVCCVVFFTFNESPSPTELNSRIITAHSVVFTLRP